MKAPSNELTLLGFTLWAIVLYLGGCGLVGLFAYLAQ